MSEVQILLLLLLSGYLISVSLGMVIIPRDLGDFPQEKDCMMSRILERYTRPRFPAWVACRFFPWS